MYFYRNKPCGKQKLKSNYFYNSILVKTIKYLERIFTTDLKDHTKRKNAERKERNPNMEKIYCADGLEDSELLKRQFSTN